jgi:hypothetical protein
MIDQAEAELLLLEILDSIDLPPYSEGEFSNQAEYVIYVADEIEGLSHELAQLPRNDLKTMIAEHVFA